MNPTTILRQIRIGQPQPFARGQVSAMDRQPARGQVSAMDRQPARGTVEVLADTLAGDCGSNCNFHHVGQKY